MGSPPSSRAKNVLVLLCSLTTLGILFCTLWPFDPFPPNRVFWLGQTNGIRFAQRGVVLGQQALGLPDVPSEHSCSIEIWIKPASTDSVSTILDIYDPGNPWRFLVRQYHSGLIISYGIPVRGEKPRRMKIDIDEGLELNHLTLVTMTSSADGTRVYFNGRLKKAFPGSTSLWVPSPAKLSLALRPCNPMPGPAKFTDWLCIRKN